MALADIWAIRPQCRLGNQIGINVLGYQTVAETLLGATPNEVAAFFDNLLGPLYPPLITNAATYEGTYAAKIFPLPPSLNAFVSANTAGGTAGTAALPSQVSGIITKLSNFGGRAYRGRLYIPFADEADNDNATHRPTNGYMTRLFALANQLIPPRTVMGVGGNTVLAPIIHSRTFARVVGIVDTRPNQKWATQRRRGDYGRLNP